MRSPIGMFDGPRFESLPDDIKAIIETVSTETQHAVQALLGKRRTAELVVARARLALELRSHGLSLCEIGSILNRDHSTIVYHLRLANGGTPPKRKQQVEIVVPKIEKMESTEPVQVSFIPEPEPQPEPVKEKEKRTPKAKRISNAKESALTMPLPSVLDTGEFREALGNWLEYKASRNETCVGGALTMLINRCKRWGVARSLAAMEFSMASTYQGLFESKDRVPTTQAASIIDLCAEAYDNSRNS